MSVPTEFFTWELLGTLAGAAAAVFVLVQLVKSHLPAVVPVRLFCWVLAYIILTGAAWSAGTLTGPVALLNVLNAGIVALTAMGAYELAKDAGVAAPRADS